MEKKGKAVSPVRFSPMISDICLTGFEYHDLGPASLSVLQLDRTELVHMRHVMVKIELDSREVEDCVVTRVEAGRVCVVCTTTRFSIFSGPGLRCSVCRYTVCSQCTAANTGTRRTTTTSLPSSPPPPSPSSTSPSPPSPPSPTSLTARLGKIFSPRRSSVDSPHEVLCRPCSQFVEQVRQQRSSYTTEVLVYFLVVSFVIIRDISVMQQYCYQQCV